MRTGASDGGIVRQDGCTRGPGDPLCGYPDKWGWSCCGRKGWTPAGGGPGKNPVGHPAVEGSRDEPDDMVSPPAGKG